MTTLQMSFSFVSSINGQDAKTDFKFESELDETEVKQETQLNYA